MDADADRISHEDAKTQRGTKRVIDSGSSCSSCLRVFVSFVLHSGIPIRVHRRSSAVHSLAVLCLLCLSAAGLAAPVPELGANASLHGRRPFPAENPWNRAISQDPVDPRSERLIAAIGAELPLEPDFGATFGKPYVVVPGAQPRVPVSFEFAQQSDP